MSALRRRVVQSDDLAQDIHTDNVQHDLVGSPAGPLPGPAAAQAFYDDLSSNLATEAMTPTKERLSTCSRARSACM